MLSLGTDNYTDNLLAFNVTNTEVDFIRPELIEALGKYDLVRDCLLGEDHMKSLGEKYFPNPDKETYTPELYKRYIDRLSFLNATGLTQRTIVGKLFAKTPTVELPEVMKPMLDNVNGEGLAFDQLLEKCLAETFGFARIGLYADFRNVIPETVSIADAQELYPTITYCLAENIINWRINKYRKRLELVVVRETYESYEGFAVKVNPQYREFAIENERLVIRVHRETENTETKYEVIEEYFPTLPGGKPWTIIPFAIIGASDNDWNIDEPPLYQIATYDKSLARNSADIEEAAVLVGQPTPYVSGITEEWAKEMEIESLKMGSGRFVPLEDANSKVGLVQANAQTLIDKLMEEKMKILRHLGATVFSVDSLAQDQTATGAIFQALQIHAQLVTTSRNVVDGIKKAVGFAAMYLGIDPEDNEEIEIKLNADVLDNPLGVTGLQTASQLYKDGLLTWEEVREQLRVQGLTQYTPEEAKELIEEEGLGDYVDPNAPMIGEDQMPVENELQIEEEPVGTDRNQ